MELLGPSQCSSLSPSGAARREWSLGVQVGQHARSAFHVIPDFNLDCRRGVKENIHPRAELDQANALSAFHPVAKLFAEDDPARQKASNLLEDDGLTIAFDRYHIVLVLFGRSRIHGI